MVVASAAMGNECQQRLSSYGCANVPLNGAVSLTADDAGASTCSAFRNQYPPDTSSCGTVSGTPATLAANRVEANGQMYKKGSTGNNYSSFGSDPGVLMYRQLDGSGENFQEECQAVARMLASHDPGITRAYCYSQKDAGGFAFDAGQYVATCSANCPTLSTTVCGAATCTWWGEALNNLPTEAALAWQGFTMSTPTFDPSTLIGVNIPAWVAATFPLLDPSVQDEIVTGVTELVGAFE